MKKKPVITDPPIEQPQDISKIKAPTKNSPKEPNEKVFYDDVYSSDIDVTGSEANKKQENAGSKDGNNKPKEDNG